MLFIEISRSEQTKNLTNTRKCAEYCNSKNLSFDTSGNQFEYEDKKFSIERLLFRL